MSGRPTAGVELSGMTPTIKASTGAESTMRVESALDLINALVYKPGWRISATDHRNRFEGAIKVKIEYPAFDSKREGVREGAPKEINTYATFPIIVEECDDISLYFWILMRCMLTDLHEAREFLKVQPTYWAPFDPHRIDGMRRFRDMVKRNGEDIIDALAEVDADLKFGIA